MSDIVINGKTYAGIDTITVKNTSGEDVKYTESGQDLLQWKCDNLKTLSSEFYNYTGTFPNLDGLDTSLVTNFQSAFYYCSGLLNAPNWDLSSATDIGYMFYQCRLQSVPDYNTSSVTNFSYVLYGCDNITVAPNWNTSNGKTFNSALADTGISVAPNWDFSKATNISSLFTSCISLTEVPDYNLPEVTRLNNCFSGCKKLVNVPTWNTPKGQNFEQLFTGCTSLRDVDLSSWNFGSATSFSYMFQNLSDLTSVKFSDTSTVKTFSATFANCKKLHTVENLNLLSRNHTSDIFGLNNDLANLTLKNLRNSLKLGSGTSWGTKLTNESLVNTFKELWDLTGSTAQTLTLSTTSKENIANIYVKLVDVTDEMRAEDEYIDNKKPCVVCESTDEGAMTLIAYANSKNWTIG